MRAWRLPARSCRAICSRCCRPPYFKKYGRLPAILAFVDGVTAAAVGAITGSVIVLARRSIVDVPTALVALATIVLLVRFKKLSEPVVVGGAAVLGLIVYPLLHH